MSTLSRIIAAALCLALPSLAEQVTVLGINDMHAALDNMPRLATAVKQERAKAPDALLLSAGDNRTGNPFCDMAPHPGWPMVALMNRIGFNLSCLGNHSFDTGMDDMRHLIDNAEFKVVCANAYADDKARIHTLPYRIFERRGVTIGVLGLLQLGPRGFPDTLEEKTAGFTFRDPFEVAQEYKWLRERCDVLILLTHLGFEDDVELARQCPWADAVIGGHTHTKVDGAFTEGGVFVTQANCRATHLTRISFDVQQGRVVSKHAELLPLDSYKPDAETAEMVQGFKDDPALNEQIAENTHELAEREEVVCLFADAVRDAAKADIAVVNRGTVRVDSLPAGPIRLCDAFRIDPFGNDTVLYTLTGAELRALITAIPLIDHHGAPGVSGMSYSATLHRGNILEISDMRQADGKPIDPAKSYTVAVGAFAASSAQFPHRDPGRALHIPGNRALIQFLRAHKDIDYANSRRARIEPSPAPIP